MKSETAPDSFAIPPDLLAQIQAEAEREHRPALEVLQDAVHRYVRGNRAVHSDKSEPVTGTAAEAVAHIFETRKGRHLPEGMTIRDMMTHGRD